MKKVEQLVNLKLTGTTIIQVLILQKRNKMAKTKKENVVSEGRTINKPRKESPVKKEANKNTQVGKKVNN